MSSTQVEYQVPVHYIMRAHVHESKESVVVAVAGREQSLALRKPIQDGLARLLALRPSAQSLQTVHTITKQKRSSAAKDSKELLKLV